MTVNAHLYRHPLLLAAGLAAALVAGVTLWLEGARWWVLALVVAFAVVFVAFRWGDRPRAAHAYLAVQTALAASVLIGWPATDEGLILFNVLAAQAALLVAPRAAVGWVAVLVAVSSTYLWGRLGWGAELVLGCVGQATGYSAFAIVGAVLRRAEAARGQSQALLTELRAAHDQLQTYAAQAQQLAVLEERQRLARDLHDSAKQQAFALAAQLGAARALLAQPQGQAGAAARLAEAERLSDNLRQELEGLIQALRPPALAARGLAGALAGLASDWARQTGVPVRAELPEHAALPPLVEQALFRIAQEALANVARHSRAGQAGLALACAGGRAVLRVSDDGAGFEPAAARVGLGLASMRERAQALGGSLVVTSVPGGGTVVEASVPCL